MRGRVPVPTKLIAILLSVCLLGTALMLLSLRTFFGTTLNEPTSIVVGVTAPEQIPVKEPFAVTIEVTSLVTTSQTLHSVDLDTNYLENVRLAGSTPAYTAVHSLPLTQFTSYRYEAAIPAEETIAIELIFVGEVVGEHAGLIDVCLGDGTLCLATPMQTKVIE